MIELYMTDLGTFARDHETGEHFRACAQLGTDELLSSGDPIGTVRSAMGDAAEFASGEELLERASPRSLVESQEVWAAGVTYYRSRSARIEESEKADGGSFYDRVYEAERPELFYKGNARTTVAHGQRVRIRQDSRWNVPEPELVLVISSDGAIAGYTAGNDMSSRDIEGENPLYLPQAKVYDGSCSLGPGMILMTKDERASVLSSNLPIGLHIERSGETAYSGETTLADLKRDPEELVSFLFRDQTFLSGCFLMTGTGIIPDDSFTLAAGDDVRISIGALPTLSNSVTHGNQE
jgi:2-dehydro-3-deoxy-D-arabinonate dehydratase